MMILWTNEPLIKREMMRAGWYRPWTSALSDCSMAAGRVAASRAAALDSRCAFATRPAVPGGSQGSSGISWPPERLDQWLTAPHRFGLDPHRLSRARSPRLPITAALLPSGPGDLAGVGGVGILVGGEALALLSR
jgi:hypothetical protein